MDSVVEVEGAAGLNLRDFGVSGWDRREGNWSFMGFGLERGRRGLEAVGEV